MIKKKDITVIIPVHVWGENIKALFNEAVKSIDKAVSAIVIKPAGLDIELPTRKSLKVVDVPEGEDTNFQHMVNQGVNAVTTDWFSILEFDDEYSPKYFDNFIKYQEYNQEYNIFLPLNDLYEIEDGNEKFIGNGNEVAWAMSFSEKLGVIDSSSLDNYFNFYLTGGIFNKATWLELGGLKENIKLTFWYEFMLRAVNNGENTYVLPKVGYAHILGREGSLLDIYRKNMDKRESNFWFSVAKKESKFKVQRDVQYIPQVDDDDDDE